MIDRTPIPFRARFGHAAPWLFDADDLSSANGTKDEEL
jgi:hypothetical protein